MPNMNACHTINRGGGLLRLVWSWQENRSFLKQHSVPHVGQLSPTVAQDRAVDFAVVRQREEKLEEEYRASSYHLDADIVRIEEAVVKQGPCRFRKRAQVKKR